MSEIFGVSETLVLCNTMLVYMHMRVGGRVLKYKYQSHQVHAAIRNSRCLAARMLQIIHNLGNGKEKLLGDTTH